MHFSYQKIQVSLCLLSLKLSVAVAESVSAQPAKFPGAPPRVSSSGDSTQMTLDVFSVLGELIDHLLEGLWGSK